MKTYLKHIPSSWWKDPAQKQRFSACPLDLTPSSPILTHCSLASKHRGRGVHLHPCIYIYIYTYVYVHPSINIYVYILSPSLQRGQNNSWEFSCKTETYTCLFCGNYFFVLPTCSGRDRPVCNRLTTFSRRARSVCLSVCPSV